RRAFGILGVRDSGGSNGQESVELGIELLDSTQRGVDYFYRRDLPARNRAGDLGSGAVQRHGALNSQPKRERRLMLPTNRVAVTPATLPRLATKCSPALAIRSMPPNATVLAPMPNRRVRSRVPTSRKG